MSPVVRRGRLAAAIESNLVAWPGRPLAAALGAAAIGLACHAAPAAASTYLVDTSGDPGPGGTTSLRQAVAAANGAADNFVDFSPALDGSTITLLLGEIAINQPMTIVGPGAEKLAVSGNDSSRIFNISTPSATPIAVTLTGLRLTHGKATGNNLGGAIYTSNVSLTLEDSELDHNAATQGGAIFLQNAIGVLSASKLARTTLANNSAKAGVGQGGGLLASFGATLQIVDSAVSANTSSRGAGAQFYNVGSITIERSQVIGNQADSDFGGGLAFFHQTSSGYSTVAIKNSTISGNSAAFRSGGIDLINTRTTLTGDTLTSNSSQGDGGAISIIDTSAGLVSQFSIVDSTVSGNTATGFGGGIDVSRVSTFYANRTLIALNSTYNPSGGGGGGIALQYAKSSALILNSTLYGNYAYDHGGGVGIFDSSTGSVTAFSGDTIAGNFTFNYASNGILAAGTPQLYNSIVAGNFSHTSNQDLEGTFAEYYSLIQNVGSATITGASAHNKNGQDPQLGALAVNGGPTRTMLPALTSPALDSGGASLLGVDQRGLPRNSNGRRDIGAVERQYPEDVIFRDGFDP